MADTLAMRVTEECDNARHDPRNSTPILSFAPCCHPCPRCGKRIRVEFEHLHRYSCSSITETTVLTTAW